VAFPDEVLTEDEQVVLHLRPHGKAAVRPALVLAVAVAAVTAAWLVLPDNPGGRILLTAVAVLCAGVVVARVAWPLLVWRCTHYVLTSERLLLQAGVLVRTRQEVPLAEVNDHVTRQSIGDRILGCGTLTIDSLGEAKPVALTAVPGVRRVQNRLYELIEAERDGRETDDEWSDEDQRASR
jgi:membrane protein YdbS with pleckstrin-like domain